MDVEEEVEVGSDEKGRNCVLKLLNNERKKGTKKIQSLFINFVFKKPSKF